MKKIIYTILAVLTIVWALFMIYNAVDSILLVVRIYSTNHKLIVSHTLSLILPCLAIFWATFALISVHKNKILTTKVNVSALIEAKKQEYKTGKIKRNKDKIEKIKAKIEKMESDE